MIMEKKRYNLKENERIDSLEVKKDHERIFYSYNYKVKKDNNWRLYVRWDNFQKQPHVDRYDENGNHIEAISSREKSLKEVIELVDIFGKNLVTMDLSRL